MISKLALKNRVVVLLATYNGAKHISELLDSLLEQTYKDFIIVAHDDGSQDRTVEILKDYETQYPNFLYILDDGICCGGAKNNFSHLLNNVNFDYGFFCDQDDVWKEEKISKFIEILDVHDKSIPCVVYSDLVVVDERLNIISPSMWNYQNTGPYVTSNIKFLGCRNSVTGCAMAFNRTAAEIFIRSDSSNVVMHDWWMALLVLANNGILLPIETALTLYRQHDSNEVGAENFSLYVVFRKILSIRKFIRTQITVYAMAKKLSVYAGPFDFLYWKCKSLL
ncbi:MAG: glycosyltransferase family 2 protein [Alcanivorax sp.]